MTLLTFRFRILENRKALRTRKVLRNLTVTIQRVTTTEMATLDQEIVDLKEEINFFVAKLKTATTEKELDRFTGLINSRTGTLNRLLDEKKPQSGGKLSNL